MRKTSRTILWIGVPMALAAILWLWPYAGYGGAPADAPSFPHDNLEITHADGSGKVAFNVEVATTPAQAAYGLMFRRSLPADAGMLFVFDPPQIVSMWMKNTYIPLDMLFVRVDGVIVKIVTHAEPFSLATINSGEPVHGVIELGDGVAARDGLKVGDKVLYSAFTSAP